jgi:hypothetical protein
MSEFPLFCSEQGMKQEQYKDLLREAEHHRLIKAATQSEREPHQNMDSARRRTLLDLVRRITSLRPLGPART